MGGFTKIVLKDKSQESIDMANAELRRCRVPKIYHFYSESDVLKEWEYYKKKDGNYPEHLFPSNKIKSYNDFKKYWSAEALGEIFVPKFGTLKFDCYFNRMSKYAMKRLSTYLIVNSAKIEYVGGSWTTYLEKIEKPRTKKVLERLICEK